jgi:hypothetical protein
MKTLSWLFRVIPWVIFLGFAVLLAAPSALLIRVAIIKGSGRLFFLAVLYCVTTGILVAMLGETLIIKNKGEKEEGRGKFFKKKVFMKKWV